ncbi:FHA domain-containing protein, partial [Pseudonocardia oceani]
LPAVGPRTAARRSDAIHGVPPDGPPRPPLEAGDAGGTGTRSASGGPSSATPTGPGPGEARGHLCSGGHLNDPRSRACVLCGVRMNERTGVLVIGARPPLGLLVFDDGAAYTVDGGYLAGRMPESDERVRSGQLRSIVVEDRSGAVSRVHAEVRVEDWDVVLLDAGSRNGTFLAAPGDPSWSQVPPGQARRLLPGMRVRLGGRTFTFESTSGAS